MADQTTPAEAAKAKDARIFRPDDVLYIADLARKGESCALVGIGSSGKSRLLQSLLEPDVREFAFGANWRQYLPVYVDGNGLLEDSAWGLYEEMIDSTIQMIEGSDAPNAKDALRELHTEHTRLIDGDPRLAYRWLTHATRMLFRVMGLKCVLYMLDDIDDLLRKDRLDARLFRQLKSLRDHHKYRLCYTVASRRTIDDLAGERLNEIDSFYKLLKANTRPLGLYELEDAFDMLSGLMKRLNFELPRRIQTLLIYASGRHPGLLRAVFFALEESRGWDQFTDEQAVTRAIKQTLYNDPAVQEECYQIWDGLSEVERVALARMAAGHRPTDVQPLRSLRDKGLLNERDSGGYEIFSPVFADFVRRTTEAA